MIVQPYLNDTRQWSRVDGNEAVPATTTSLSGHATQLYVRLNSDLLNTEKILQPRLFINLWQPVLRKLNLLLYNKVLFSLCLIPSFLLVGAEEPLYRCWSKSTAIRP